MKNSFYKKSSASWLGKMSMLVIALLFAGVANAAGSSIKITGGTPGSGYTVAPSVTVPAPPAGGITAVVTATISSGGLVFTVTNSGAGYTSAPTLSLSGGTTSGTVATVPTTSLVPTWGIGITGGSGGSGYTVAPTVIVTNAAGDGGIGAVVVATLNANGSLTFQVTSPGYGYQTTPTLSLTGGTTSGTTATAPTAVLAVVGTGIGVTGGTGGTSYTVAPTISVTGGSGSSGAVSATITGGVNSYSVTNAGTGYNSPPVLAFSAAGTTSGTVATPPTSFLSNAMGSIAITAASSSSGTSYTVAPTVTVSGGGGSGAVITATITGGVVFFAVTNQGYGYTSIPTITLSGGTTTGTTAVAPTALINGTTNSYYWIGGNTGTLDFKAAGNWSTSYNGSAATPSFTTTDNFVFDGVNLGSGVQGALTVKFLTNISVGQIQLTGNANVTFSTTGGGSITCSSLDLGTANASSGNTAGATLNDGGNTIQVTGPVTGTGTHNSLSKTVTITSAVAAQGSTFATTSGSATSGNSFTVSSNLSIVAGQQIYTTAGVYVGTVASYTSPTLTTVSSATMTVSTTYILGAVYAVSSGLGIVPGQLVTGAGIAPGAFVISYSGTTLTLGNYNVSSGSGTPSTSFLLSTALSSGSTINIANTGTSITSSPAIQVSAVSVTTGGTGTCTVGSSLNIVTGQGIYSGGTLLCTVNTYSGTTLTVLPNTTVLTAGTYQLSGVYTVATGLTNIQPGQLVIGSAISPNVYVQSYNSGTGTLMLASNNYATGNNISTAFTGNSVSSIIDLQGGIQWAAQSAQTIPALTSFGNLELSAFGASYTYTATNNLTINGNLFFTRHTSTAAISLKDAGAGKTISIGGSICGTNVSPTIANNGGTLTMIGYNPTINGLGLYQTANGTFTFGNLDLNPGAGTNVNLGTTATSNFGITVTGNLNFNSSNATSELLFLNAYTALNIGSSGAATVTMGATNYFKTFIGGSGIFTINSNTNVGNLNFDNTIPGTTNYLKSFTLTAGTVTFGANPNKYNVAATTNSTNSISCNTSGIYVGMNVVGSGIPTNAYVTNVAAGSPGTVTISVAATTSVTNGSLNFITAVSSGQGTNFTAINGGTLNLNSNFNVLTTSGNANSFTLSGTPSIVLNSGSNLFVNLSNITGAPTAGVVDARLGGVSFYGSSTSTVTLTPKFFAYTSVLNFTDSITAATATNLDLSTLTSAITVTGTFRLANTSTAANTLTIGSKLNIASGATIIKQITGVAGTINTSAAPGFTYTSGNSGVNVIYTGSQAFGTGNELPTGIQNLSVTNTLTGATIITLNSSLNVYGTLALTNGNGTNAIISIASGLTLAMQSGSSVNRSINAGIISGPGTLTYAGSAPYVNFTYSNASSFSANPSIEIPNSGNIGTFTISGGIYTLSTSTSFTIQNAVNFLTTAGISLNSNTVTMANGSTITRGASGVLTSVNSYFTGTGSVKYGTVASDRVNLTINYSTNSAAAELQSYGSPGSIGTLTIDNGATYTINKNISIDALVIKNTSGQTTGTSTLAMGAYQLLENSNWSPVTATWTTTNGVVTCATTGLAVGMPVTGSGIPAGTTISGVTAGTGVTLSATPTIAGSSATLYFNSLGSGTSTVSVATGATTAGGIITTGFTGATSPLPIGKTWGGTVSYTAASHIAAATSYNNLILASNTYTNDGNLTVNGTYTSVAGTTLNLGTFTFSTTTTPVLGAVNTACVSSTPLPIPSGLTWSGLVTFSGSGTAQTIPAGTYNGGLTLGNTTGASIASSSNIVIVGGTFTVSGNTTTSLLTIGNNTLKLQAGVSVSATGSNYNIDATAAGATVVYNGSALQTIAANTYKNGNINNLTINNSTTSSGATNGAVSINTALTVGSTTSGGSGVLTLTKGMVFFNGGSLTISNPLYTGISATTFNSNSYINGPLSWALPASPSANNYLFPVGAYNSGDVYYGFTLNSPTVSAAATVTVQAYASAAAGSAEGTTLGSISSSEYWTIAATGGDLSSATTVGLYSASSVQSKSKVAYSADNTASSYYQYGGSVSGSTCTSASNADNNGKLPNVAAGNTAYLALGILNTTYKITGVVSTTPYGFQTNSGTSNGYFGQQITINGQGFTDKTQIEFGGTGTGDGSGYYSPTSHTSTSMSILVPGNAVSGSLFISEDGGTTSTQSVSAFTVLGYISTVNASSQEWTSTGTWLGGVVPAASSTVTISAGSTVNITGGTTPPVNSISQLVVQASTTAFGTLTFNTNGGTTGSLTINNNGSVSTSTNGSNIGLIDMTSGGTLTFGSGASFNNNGSFTAGTGTVVFSGAGSLTGNATTFNNLTLNGALTPSVSPVINGTLQMNAGASFATISPTYTSASTLQYNAQPVTTGLEWGVPTTIGSVIMTSAGGYTQAPLVTIGNAWPTTGTVTAGTQYYNNGNLYTATNNGTYGTAPTATSGSGTVSGGTATWTYAGVAATGTASLNIVGTITINNPGSGYYNGVPVVTIAPPVSGTTATAVAVLSATGTVSSFVITNPGSGYTSAPAVTIAAPSSGTTATATALMGVSGITITNAGSGYTSLPSVNIATTYGTGAGANAVGALGYGVPQNVTIATNGYGTATAVTTAGARNCVGNLNIQSGYLLAGGTLAVGSSTSSKLTIANPGTITLMNSFNIISGGSSYSSAPTVAIVGGGGTGATATATVSGGLVTGLTLTNAGSGYTSQPYITFTGGGGSGAYVMINVNNVPALDMAGNILQGTFTPAGTGSLYTQNGGVANSTGVGPSIPCDYTWLGTVWYNGGSNQRMMPGTYNNLNGAIGGNKNWNNSNSNTGVFIINGTLTIPDGTTTYGGNNSTVIFNGSNQVIPGIQYNNLTIGSSATGTTFGTSSATNLSIYGVFNNLSSVAGSNQGTITFDGSNGQTIPSFNYYNLNINTARAGNVILTSSGTIGVAGTYANSATYTAGAFSAGSSTINYNGTSTQTVIATTYNNLIISNRSATVTLASSGNISIAGDFTNNLTSGSLTVTTSTLNFNGSVNQNINSTNALSINNLIINNTGTGTNVAVNKAVTLGTAGILTLTNGRITTTSTNSLTVTNTTSGTSAVNSANNAYVDGPLTWTLPANTNSGTYIFPIGKYVVINSTSYNYNYPLTLNSPNVSSSGSATVTAEAFKASTGGSADGSGGGGTLQKLSSNQYWALTTSANFTSSSVSLTATSGDVTGFNAIGYSTTKLGSYSTIGGGANSTGFSNSSGITGSGYLVFATLQVAAAPTITSVSATTPNTISGNEGYGGSTITIIGSSFSTTTGVVIGGSAASSYTVVDDSHITAVVATSGVSSGSVQVTNSNTNVNFSGFTFHPGLVSKTTGDWSATATWLTGVVPTAGSTVTIAHAVTLNTAAASPANLTINSGISLSLGTTAAASVTVSTSLTNNGTLNVGSASNYACSVTLGSGSTSSNSATGTITVNRGSSSTTLVVAGSLTNSGAINENSNLQINNGASITGGGTIVYGSSSVLYYNTTSTFTPGSEWQTTGTNLSNGAPQTVQFGGAPISPVGSISVSLGSGRTIVGGLVINNGYSASLASGSTLSIGTATISGTFNIGGSGATLTTSSTTTVSGTLNIANGGQVSAGNSITVSSGGTLNIGATALTSTPAISGTDASLIFTNSNLSVSSGGIVNLYGYLKTSASSSVSQSGTMTVAKNAVFEAANPGSAIPTATWDANSYLYLTGLAGAPPTNIGQTFGNVIWNCASMSGAITLTNGTFNNIGNFYLLNTNGNAVRLTNGTNAWGSLQVGGTLTFNGGTIGSNALLDLCYTASAANTTVSGNVAINSGSTVSATQLTTLTIKGDFTQNGSFTNTNTTVAFTGTGVSNVAATSGTIAFNSLTINKSGGTAANAKVVLAAPTTVGSGTTGVLTLTQGRIVTDATNTLTIANTSAGAISGGSSSPAAYIDGALTRTLPAASNATGTYVYPVGTYGSSDNYYPLTLNSPATGTGTTTVTVQSVKASTGGGSADGSSLSAISGNQYWTLASTGTYTGSSVSLAGTTGDISGSGYTYNTIGFSTTKTGTYASYAGTATTSGVNNSNVVPSAGYLLFATLYVSPSPTITTVIADIPSGGSNTGYSGTTLTINGTDFSTVSSVTIGGSAATYSIINNTQLKAIVPASVSTTDITVTNSNPTNPTATKTGFLYLTGYASKQAGDWNTGSTWLGGVAPSGTTSTVTITNNGVVTLNASATVANLTINSGATLSLSTTANNGLLSVTSAFKNDGTFNYAASNAFSSNNSTISGSFTNNGTVNIGSTLNTSNTYGYLSLSGSNNSNTGTITVNNGSTSSTLFLSGALNNTGTILIKSALQLNNGGSITGNGVVYGTNAGLYYNTGSTITAGAEWLAGANATTIGSNGVPYNVTIGDTKSAGVASAVANTVVNFGTASAYRAMAGALTISITSTGAGLQLSSVNGGDLKIAGSFTATQTNANAFNSLPGGFDANSRMVYFIAASGAQTVTGPAASAITFHYITIGTDATSTNYVNLGSDISITAPNGGVPVTLTAPITSNAIYYLNATSSTTRNITIGTTGKAISGTVYIRGGGASPANLTIIGTSNSTLNLNIDYGGGNSNLANVTVNNVNVALQSVLTVKGNLVNNGTISGSPVLTIGGSAAQTIDGTGTINNLTLNNAAGVTINSGNQSITGILKVSSGTLNTGTNGLTLKSTSITNSAIVDQVGGAITGTATVERYIPADGLNYGYLGYRDMAPEVYGAGTINKNWQEGATSGALNSAASNPHPGYGIFITGPSAAYTDASNAGAIDANGFDKSGTGGSLNTQDYTYDPTYTNTTAGYGHFKAFANTTTTNLDAFTGYRLLIRGDRSPNLYTTNINEVGNTATGKLMYNATTLRATGNLVYGTVTYNSTGVTATANAASVTSTNALNTTPNGFSMIANPYVCPVKWSTVYTASGDDANSHINASYWYLDPTSSATGKYIAYNAKTGSASQATATTFIDPITGLSFTTYNSQSLLGNIQAGQAVFVQSLTSSPQVVFTEAAKVASSTKTAVFGTATLSKIYVSLLKQTTGATTYNRVDGAAVAFRSDFGNTTYGSQDALKLSGASDNLSISDKGKNLSIDGRLPATASDAIGLKITSPSATAYQLTIDASNYSNNGFEPLVYDAYKNTTKALGTGTTTINFTVDAAQTATFQNRFTILFTPIALPVNSIVASASLSNKVATITWNTVGEKSVARFEVEKSTDAKTFVTIGQATAKNTATASYATTDNSVTATTYYRIKAVSTTGATSYSNVAKVQLSVNSNQYTVYPNPLKGSTLNVTLDNVSAGKYVVSITNVLGQKVSEQTISHEGGSATHAININNAMAAGMYNVSIMEANSKQVVHQTNLSVQP